MKYYYSLMIRVFAALAICIGLFSHSSYAKTAVGTVSFALGDAEVVREDGVRESVEKGVLVYSGDTLSTRHNGYVHLQFIDDARVSVRPQSSLQVLEYRYSAQSPASSRVHFNLEQGVSRSISGQAAKKARENFRFETPVAAIGVRGTDFTVSANTQASQAFVHEGAITVELNQPCLPECRGESLLLDQYDQRVLQVMRDHQVNYASVDQQPYFTASTLLAASEKVDQDSLGKKEVETVVMNARLESIQVLPVSSDYGASPSEAAPVDYNDRQLTWGVWSQEGSTPASFILNYDEIAATKKVAVGNDLFVLFRDTDVTERVYPGLGQVSFELDQGFATLEQASLEFRAAGLNIDFERNRFDTQLEMFNQSTGVISFDSRGGLYDGGFFYSRSNDQRLGGAVSFDGTEAGYFFNRSLPQGQLQGVTLWGASE